ncbi:MAG: hypothetical protein AB7P03_28970 [Kofleriaceae bacterium]
MLPPQTRGERVRVVEQLADSEVPAATPVGPNTQIIVTPQPVSYGSSGSIHVGGHTRARSGGIGLGGGGRGNASSGKAAAAVFLVMAAAALVAVAGVESSRFDGWAQLHPMHPVHLIGYDGIHRVAPLAWIDPQAVASTKTALVRSSEGPWLQLERAPLSREGFTYGMYGGHAAMRSAYGDRGFGPAFTVQGGYFPSQEIGIVVSVFFGWRDNRDDNTLFESRYTAELQALPVHAGRFHAGLYGGVGVAYRFEDEVMDPMANAPGSSALTGGAMLQLDVNTHMAITARLGAARAHDEEMHDITIGLSVY